MQCCRQVRAPGLLAMVALIVSLATLIQWHGWPRYDTIIQASIVVMGTARNIAYNDADNVASIRRLSKEFHLTRVIVFEDGSTDKTLYKLKAWQTALGVDVDVLSETNVTGSRTVRIAHARNALWRTLRALSPPRPDFVIMLDLDGVNNDLVGVDKCFDLPLGWGACCANQRTNYYDIWALRTFDDWVDCDVWFECTKDICKRLRHVNVTAAPIQVKSCFGGAALYHLRTINGSAWYSGELNGHEQCEHVPFHQSLGAPLYIQPGMLNEYHFNMSQALGC